MVTSQGMNVPLDPPSPAADADDPVALWAALGWQPDAEQLGALEALQQELRQWNARLNLTRLVEGDDYWIAQVFDSLWPWRSLLHSPAAPLQLVDVGTGGGFPGLVLAIALPQARLTLVDSVGRKAAAVQAMAASLGLDQRVVVRCERAELSGRSRDCRGRFDWALARAVAAAPVVAEYLVPLLRPGGQALLYRGQWSAEDQQAMERAVLPLRAELRRVERQELPSGRGVRHAVVVAATGLCPQLYPRPVGVPAKLPLG
jgi:16S rRNA (guanine527-N7)-methyltransferase